MEHRMEHRMDATGVEKRPPKHEGDKPMSSRRGPAEEKRRREVALQMREEGLSTAQIGEALGISKTAAHKLLMRIDGRARREVEWDARAARVTAGECTVVALAQELGITPSSVSHHLAKRGLTRAWGGVHGESSADRQRHIGLLYGKGLSVKDIAAAVGISKQAVRQRLAKGGV